MSKHNFYQKFKKSDIFNIYPTKEPLSPSRKNMQPTLEKTSNDIFPTESNNSKKTLYKHKNKYINKSQSDIFNKKPQNLKIKIRETPTTRSQINQVNLDLNNKDYIVKKPIKKIYNPDPYKNNKSPLDRFYEEIYGEENIHKNIISKRNYLEIDFKNKNNEEIVKNDPIKKNVNWTNETSANINSKNLSPKMKKLNAQISNIFNIPDKYYNNIEINRKKEEEKEKKRLNKLEEERIREKEKEMKILSERTKEDKYEFGSLKSKWKQSNIDWKKPEISVMLMKQNDKENEKLNAFQRKQKEFNLSEKYNKYSSPNKLRFNPFDNSNQISKIRKLMDLNSPLFNESRKIKMIQNASTNNFFENNFYEKILKTDKNFINENEEYVALNKGNNRNDEKSLKRIFSNEGIHIYDVQLSSNKLFGERNDSEITFKIRDNKDNNNKINEVFEKINKEKNIEIKPKTKIYVNKKKYDNNNDKQNIKLIDKINFTSPKFSKDKLSEQYYKINVQYKNNNIKQDKNN